MRIRKPLYMKTAILLGLFALSMASQGFAKEAIVKGVGADKNSAIRDATRNAVEQIVGTYIDSKSIVSQNQVVLDDIYAKSQGFVKNVEVLESRQVGGQWEVTAKVDVDTNPNSQLMNRIAMIVQLDDPRIAVIISYHVNPEGEGKSKYLTMCTAAVNEALIKQGFTHVVVPISPMEDGAQDNYNGMDYVVLGQLDVNTNPIMLPKYSDYTSEEYAGNTVATGLTRTIGTLDMKVIRADNHEVVGEFQVLGNAIKDNENNSENAAAAILGQQAAEKVKGLFARAAASINVNVQVLVRTENYENVSKLETVLKGTAGVNGAKIKDFATGKGTIYLDTQLNPNQIFKKLKTEANLNVFLETASANVLEISMGE